MSLFDNLFDRISEIFSLNMPNIGMNSIVDILVVAIIIYLVIKWIKETRAWSLFKGILVIILISAISYLFDLYTVWWIISSAFSLGILALVIIFQPEMRHALEELGKGKLIFEGQSSDVIESSIDEVVRAAGILSKEKTGALIVFEREVPLGDLEINGIAIDAIVSNQLIINIFENKTPLHDGAVIIRNGRIAAAACILPLSQRDVSDNMGTRHRAAIGASEASDAVIAVVSEETGIISVSKGGIIHRNLTEDKMREMLITSMRPFIQTQKRTFLWGRR